MVDDVSNIAIEQRSVSFITGAPEFPALIAEYARESANSGLPPPEARIAIYLAYEAAGILHAFTAEQDGEIVGFIAITAPVNPHYGLPLAVSESFFVSAAHRKGGTWRKLLQAGEQRARLLGSPGLYVAAPAGSPLADALPMTGYRESNVVFFKGLHDA